MPVEQADAFDSHRIFRIPILLTEIYSFAPTLEKEPLGCSYKVRPSIQGLSLKILSSYIRLFQRAKRRWFNVFASVITNSFLCVLNFYYECQDRSIILAANGFYLPVAYLLNLELHGYVSHNLSLIHYSRLACLPIHIETALSRGGDSIL